MKHLAIFFFFLIAASASLFAQTVTNVEASLEGNNVVVSYNIDRPASEVSLKVSTDGGKTFSEPLKQVYGSIIDVHPGRHKIVWDVRSEMEDFKWDNVVFDVFVDSPMDINSHEYVDLGLSVKWASCNVGATKPEEYGDYFAWAETSPKSVYSVSTVKYNIDSAGGRTSSVVAHGVSAALFGITAAGRHFSKYVTKSKYGIVDNKTCLETSDDAASANWGDDWRMPTWQEWRELYDNCDWSRTTRNGVNGYIVTGKKPGFTGSSIFLPLSGCRRDEGAESVGISGFYWSSSLDSSDSVLAHFLYMDQEIFPEFMPEELCFPRFLGFSVRPVSKH